MSTQRSVAKAKIPYTRSDLYGSELPAYFGESLRMVSFPLGGIGTGCIGLGGRGELRDWEIFNNPNLNFRPPYTMPYIFCRQGQHKIAKVLDRRLLPPYHASHGLPPENLSGLPRLDEAIFIGTYPVARIFFRDDELTASVQLEAFNPMIPGNADDSAIPAAILIYRLVNRTKQRVSGSVALSMSNEVGRSGGDGKPAGGVNAFRQAENFRGIYMSGRKHKKGRVGYGTQALVTLAPKVTCATDFDEVGWVDRGQKAWDDYSADGRLSGPTRRSAADTDKRTLIGMLAAEYDLRPGKAAEIVFVITWSFPHRLAPGRVLPEGTTRRPIRNHYAGKFPDAWRAARYVAENFERLRAETLRFERALFDSTLPGVVLDAVSSQMSTIRTNTTMWLDSPEDEPAGRIFAFEGCGPTEGCCPTNCTHVWNYEQALGHLYPSLERTMRLTDYQDNLHRSGAMVFRTTLPLRKGLPLWQPKVPAADGQFGTVVKVHREWRISGDDGFLKRLWPAVKQSVRFAWKGFAKWDADKDGMMEGIQHNTYDIDFHGPNTMCGSLYLAGLLAAREMAQAVGDTEAAEEFRSVYESGRKKYDKLFNGEFYIQKVRRLKKGEEYEGFFGARFAAGRPKYQYGFGCLCDQLLGQWAAHVAGLGYVLSEEHVRKALGSIFRYNFRANLAEHQCCQRVYALDDEAGLVICTWPNGRREKFPFPYSDEVWTGIEYQVAAHMIYEGMIQEALVIVAAVRERHDGIRRNPWNEFECGDHYARAMSSWSLLLALSGQRYDGRTQTLAFQPALWPENFSCIYTASDAYGTVAQRFRRDTLEVRIDCLAGRVGLKSLEFTWPRRRRPKNLQASAKLNGKALEAVVSAEGTCVRIALTDRVCLDREDVLTISLRRAASRRR